MSPLPSPSSSSWLLRAGLVALAYFLTARLGLLLPYAGSAVTLIWLPTGIAVAALWRWGDRMLVGILVAVVALVYSRSQTSFVAWPIAFGNALAPWVTVALLRRFGFEAGFNARRHVPALVSAAMLGMLISATIGVASLFAAGTVDAQRAGPAWLRWWIGDVVGVLLAGPPLMMLSRRVLKVDFSGVSVLEWIGTMGLALIVGAVVFLSTPAQFAGASWLHGPLVFVPFLPLAWLAVRSAHPFYPALAVLLLAAVAAFGTARGLGPFGGGPDPHIGLAVLWGYVVSLGLIVLLLGTLAAEVSVATDRMRGLFLSSRDAILLTYGDGRVEAVNPAAEALFGLPEAEIRRRGRDGLMDPADPRLTDALRQRDAAGSAKAVLRAFRGDGSSFEAEAHSSRYIGKDGQPRNYVVMQDVSRRESDAQALRDSEERLRMALDGGSVGLWDWNIRADLMHWDERSCRVYGLPSGTVMSTADFRRRVFPDDLALVMQSVQRALDERRPYECEYRILLPDGSPRWVLGSGRLRFDDQGRVQGMTGTMLDVSERRRAAEAMVQAEAAERSSRLKSEFLSSMSHELRTPLNAILGFAQLLSAGIGNMSDKRLRDHAGQIEKAGWHLLAMIDDVLDLSRIDSGQLDLQLQPVRLADALPPALALLQTVARQADVFLSVGPVPASALVHADPVRLRQVLSNLLSNGVKYNRAGGWVAVAIERVAEGWRVEVSDSGIGMDAAQLAQLFEPFNRLGRDRSAIEGTGIGLVITRRLVDAMGGRLEVHSVAGQGSRFAFTLPGDDIEASPPMPPARVAEEPAPPQGTGRRAARVLAVEDNPVNAMIVEQVLGSAGHQVRIAASAADGWALAREWQPDLILLDMALPDEHGLVLRQRLLADAELCGVPCVAVSAQATASDLDAAQAGRFFAYIVKPFDIELLRRTVSEALASSVAGSASS